MDSVKLPANFQTMWLRGLASNSSCASVTSSGQSHSQSTTDYLERGSRVKLKHQLIRSRWNLSAGDDWAIDFQTISEIARQQMAILIGIRISGENINFVSQIPSGYSSSLPCAVDFATNLKPSDSGPPYNRLPAYVCFASIRKFSFLIGGILS